MDNKKLGIIILIAAVFLIVSTAMIKSKEDALVRQIIAEQEAVF